MVQIIQQVCLRSNETAGTITESNVNIIHAKNDCVNNTTILSFLLSNKTFIYLRKNRVMMRMEFELGLIDYIFTHTILSIDHYLLYV